MADVTVQCYTPEHRVITNWAYVAVAIYPVGLMALSAALLLAARVGIQSAPPTALSMAISVLHKEYETPYYCVCSWTFPHSTMPATAFSHIALAHT